MKYKIRRRRHKTVKTRHIFLIMILGLICISISYARFNTTLRINGTVTGEQAQYNVTYLYFSDPTSFPQTVMQMDTFTYTFPGSPNIVGVIMGERTLTLNTDYYYSNGTITIPDVTGNLVIQSDSVGEEVWVTYSFGNESFSGFKCINTDIPLFSSENVNRDFEIYVTVSNFQYLSGQDSNRNVLLCNQNETGTPYQGFAFHYRDSAMKVQVNGTKVPDVNFPWGKLEGTIKLSRINNVFYVDDVSKYNFGSVIVPFNAPLSIGANLDVSGNPRRYSKVNLSDIRIRMKYTYSEYVSLCQNLPSPERTSSVFSGWYTSSEGGTEITTMGQLEANNRTLYAQWEPAGAVHIIFNANGGTGTMNKQPVTRNVSSVINTNTFTKQGYRFVGWATASNGTGNRYTDGGSITLTEDITLYAQWLSVPQNSFTLASKTFTGGVNEIIDTGVYLFSNDNIHRNFEIYFELGTIGKNTSQETIMGTKDESGSPYPGIVFRITNGKLLLKADSDANNTNKDERALGTIQKVRIIRINDITYYSINDESYQVLMDFTNIYRTFDAPVTFGGIIKPDGTRDRGYKGTISNMSVQFISDSATLADYENALPSQ